MPYKEHSRQAYKDIPGRWGITLLILFTLNLTRDAQAQRDEPENPDPNGVPGLVMEGFDHAAGHIEVIRQTATATINARLREKPTTNSRSAGLLEAGEEVIVVREFPDGQQITINGTTSQLWYEVERGDGNRAFVWSGLLDITEVAEEVTMPEDIDDDLSIPEARSTGRVQQWEAEKTSEALPATPDIPPEIRVSFPDVNNHKGDWIDLLLEINQESLIPDVEPGLIEDTQKIPALAELEALIEERFQNGNDTEFNQSAMSGILIDIREGRSGLWTMTLAFSGEDDDWYTMVVSISPDIFLTPIDAEGNFVAPEEERFMQYQARTRVTEEGIQVDRQLLQPGDQIVIVFYDPPEEAEALTPTAKNIRQVCGNRSPSEALQDPDEEGIIYSHAAAILYHE